MINNINSIFFMTPESLDNSSSPERKISNPTILFIEDDAGFLEALKGGVEKLWL
jgi:hypothetical protein